MLQNPNVTEFLFFAPAPDSVYKAFFQAIIDDTALAVPAGHYPESPTLIIRNGGGKFMGMAALTRVPMLTGNYEIGFQLPQYAWRKGIATGAAQLLTRLAFNQLGAHKVCADCYGGNTGSQKVLEKVGYQKEGEHACYYMLDNKNTDSKLFYGMSKKQFENN